MSIPGSPENGDPAYEPNDGDLPADVEGMFGMGADSLGQEAIVEFEVPLPGDSRGVDEVGLEIEFGIDVFDGDRADLAEDWVEIRDVQRTDPRADEWIFAHLVGPDELERLKSAADARGDEVLSLQYMWMGFDVQPERLDAVLETISDYLGNSLAGEELASDTDRQQDSEDDPPVIGPHLATAARWGA